MWWPGRLTLNGVILLSLLVGPVGCAGRQALAAHVRLDPISLTWIHMVTPHIGWGSDQTRYFHTVDGGHDWRNVTPPIPWADGYSQGSEELDVVGADAAWLALPNVLGPKTPTIGYIFHTENGGRTWRRLPPLRLGPYYYLRQLQFVDRHHGWLLVMRDVYMMQLTFDIYRTGDGGRHWRRIVYEGASYLARHQKQWGILPSCDCFQDYTYVTPTSGWLAGCYCGIGSQTELLYQTSDGGVSWHPDRLALPPTYRSDGTAIAAPIFFTHQIAVLPVYIFKRGGMLFDLFQSEDGGRTWRSTSPLRVQQEYDPSSLVDPSHAFVLDGRWLDRTTDGGRHWSRIRSHLSRDHLAGFDFVAARIGFALESLRAGDRNQLLQTTDGGLSWRVVRTYLKSR